jgi:adenine/guanine phosphoribosyltransferase-like PRPP-binding protein
VLLIDDLLATGGTAAAAAALASKAGATVVEIAFFIEFDVPPWPAKAPALPRAFARGLLASELPLVTPPC